MQKAVKSNHGIVLFNSYIGPLSGATTPSQSEPESDGNEGVLRMTGTSPSDCLVLYPGHSLVGGGLPLQRSSRCILLPQPTGQPFTGKENPCRH